MQPIAIGTNFYFKVDTNDFVYNRNMTHLPIARQKQLQKLSITEQTELEQLVDDAAGISDRQQLASMRRSDVDSKWFALSVALLNRMKHNRQSTSTTKDPPAPENPLNMTFAPRMRSWTEEIQLKEGESLCPIPALTPRSDLNDMAVRYRQKLWESFGVSPDRTHHLKNEAVEEERKLRTVVSQERKSLIEFFEFIWHETERETEVESLSNDIARIDIDLKKNPTEELKQQRQDLWERSQTYVIEFPKDPFASLTAIEDYVILADRGVLTAEESVNLLRQSRGLAALEVGHPLIKAEEEKRKRADEQSREELATIKINNQAQKKEMNEPQQKKYKAFSKVFKIILNHEQRISTRICETLGETKSR